MALGEHLTREVWIAAAREVLVLRGVDDIKIDRLARSLNVTRGSFYWHFRHRDDLLEALWRDWEAANHREIELVRARMPTRALALVELFRLWLGEDPTFPSFDTAIRVWARKSPPVAEVVHAVDAAWIGVFRRCFHELGIADPEADVRARVMYFHQVGYYALALNESIADRLKLAPFYYAVLTGREVPPELFAVLDELSQGSRAEK